MSASTNLSRRLRIQKIRLTYSNEHSSVNSATNEESFCIRCNMNIVHQAPAQLQGRKVASIPSNLLQKESQSKHPGDDDGIPVMKHQRVESGRLFQNSSVPFRSIH